MFVVIQNTLNTTRLNTHLGAAQQRLTKRRRRAAPSTSARPGAPPGKLYLFLIVQFPHSHDLRIQRFKMR